MTPNGDVGDSDPQAVNDEFDPVASHPADGATAPIGAVPPPVNANWFILTGVMSCLLTDIYPPPVVIT
jgi:hypothetical protein